MLQNNFFNRVWVRLVVILIQIPLYFIIAYITFSLLRGESLVYRVLPNSAVTPLLVTLFHGWILCELMFSIHYALAKRRLAKYNQEIPDLSSEDRWGLINQCLETVDDPVEWFKGWFRERETKRQPVIDDIRKDNVREW
jgi:hypothetical protein